MIFETHAHYDDEAFDEDREVLIASLRENGIEKVINIGASMASSKSTLELVERYDFFYGAVGVHPNETGELTEKDYEWLKNATAHERVVAVGEIGLDYHYEEPPRQHQQIWFERQLQLAAETNLPVVIHSRDAQKDTEDILRRYCKDICGGVIHCFSYTKESAKKFLDMGFHIGVGGVVTFKNARKLKEAVEYIPMERIVLETDCPYLAPEPNRGRRNSSLNIPYIAEAIAEIKGMEYDEVVRITNENAKRLFLHK